MTIELTEEEKGRLRAEEVFRAEVQRELAAMHTQERSWLSGLFESSRSRFIATAFIIPFFIWLFTYLQSEIQASKAESAYLGQLRVEASERISGSARFLRQKSPRFFDDVNNTYHYPEFEKWGLALVVNELAQKDESLSRDALASLLDGLRREDPALVAKSASKLGWYN